MQYMLLIYNQTGDVNRTEEQWDEIIPKYRAYGDMLRAREAYVSAAPLAPPSSATTLRMQQGQKAVLDGPFAETKEWLGGYYIVNAATLDEALRYAEQCPALQHGAAVEVRPVLDTA
ncbi:MAG: YciI family protein [Candidatus Eremiobacteraeota bacterium]|nr:YciI family protein [Candidatus Eremiobacteraeota bacterium]